jgi:hypothetical protein
MRLTSFNDAVADHRSGAWAIRRVTFEFHPPEGDISPTQHRALSVCSKRSST